jgi:hypothetical protein
MNLVFHASEWKTYGLSPELRTHVGMKDSHAVIF